MIGNHVCSQGYRGFESLSLRNLPPPTRCVRSPATRRCARRQARACGTTRMKPWFVYVARCADGTLYVGVARDVASRIAAHDSGKGARYTRGRGPLEVLATRRCAGHGDALRLEIALKRLPREKKLSLCASRHRFARFVRERFVARPGAKDVSPDSLAFPRRRAQSRQRHAVHPSRPQRPRRRR
jgi:putative endonuclease